MAKTLYIATFLLCFGWSISSAEIYRFVDKRGVIHYTNIPSGKKFKKISATKTTRVKRYAGKKSLAQKPLYYSHIVDNTSRKYNLEPSLINAIIKVESNWNSTAVSHKGAQGLMQLMPYTAKNLNVKNPFNPQENIEGGAKYVRMLLDKFNGDIPLALAAYNAGPKKIEKFRGIPPIPETRQFVDRVLALYDDNRISGSVSPIHKVKLQNGTTLYTNTRSVNDGSSLTQF
jgi:soluble lytic murein transglycosylase